MPHEKIVVVGARENNLKNVTVEIPRDQIVDAAKGLPEGTKLQILAPIVRGRKGEYKKELQEIGKAGYVRVRVDGQMYEVTDDIPMDRYKQHTIEVIVDRIVVKEGIDRRVAGSIENALKMGKGMVSLSYELPEGAANPLGVRDLGRALDEEAKPKKGKSASKLAHSQRGYIDVDFSERYSC